MAPSDPRDYKVLYTCFEGRRPNVEAAAPNGGVPSGGGFHLIGDPAETILNDLEAGPIVVAAASGNPFRRDKLPSGRFAYGRGDGTDAKHQGLSDVVTVRWLFPGEAFFTGAGSVIRNYDGHTTADEDHDLDQSNYHWFFFHSAANVCTEEIVNLANNAHRSPPPVDFEP